MQIINRNSFLLITVALSMFSSIAGAQSQGETKGAAAEIDDGPWDTPAQLALFTARNMPALQKPEALHSVALALSHAGKKEPARDVVIEIMEEFESSPFLQNRRSVNQFSVAAEFTEFYSQKAFLEMLDTAWTEIESSDRERTKQYALYELVNAMAKAGETGKAKEIVNGITDPYHKTLALIDIAHREDDKSALLTLKKALTTVAMIKEPREASSEKGFSLYLLAKAFAKAGDAKQAMTVANRIEKESEYVPVRNRIALALAERGDRKEALAVVEQALGGARGAIDLTKSAKVLSELGEKERAVAILKQALGEARKSGNGLYAIGWEFGKLGQEALALETLNQAIEVAHTKRESLKVIELRNIGDILLNLGHEELALKTLNQAIWKNEEGTTRGTAFIKTTHINQLAKVLATEIMDDDYRAKRRMKDTFTPKEKRFAKRLVQYGQTGEGGQSVQQRR